MNRVQTNYTDFWNTSRNSQLIIDSFLSSDSEAVKPQKDLVKLAGYKKAISNFVNIISGQSVKVTFKGTDSYTDGKTVTLSGNIDEKNFDFNCGLAMHEGSHIVYSTFLKYSDYIDMIDKMTGSRWMNSKAVDHDTTSQLFVTTVKELTNYFEDRRIDNIVYNAAPGYRGYYKALYEKYFNSKTINKALKSKTYSEEVTVSNYMFYIANMTNQFTDSNDLPGLRKIFKLINLNNISRLKDTAAAAKLAIVTTKEIFDIVDLAQKEERKKNPGAGEAERKEDGAGKTREERRKLNPTQKPSQGQGNTQLSDRQAKMLENAVDKQKELISGKVKKTGLKRNEEKMMQSLSSAGATKQEVEVTDEYGEKSKCDVLVLERVTEEVADSHVASFLRKSRYHDEKKDKAIAEGLRLGSMLGRKLQIRNEEQTLKTTRQTKGKIDKRIIAELGFDNTNVFQQMYTNRFKAVNIHISVDASGSMTGSKFKNSIKSVIAICKAASMTKNISVQVTFRGTVSRSSRDACVAVLYDSKKNNIKHLIKFIGFTEAGGLTPEGLCFNALNKLILDSKSETNIFVNYSDGMPYCENYNGDAAIRHTKKEVDKLKYNGFKVMSFFITDGEHEYESTKNNFKTMYGKDAMFIEPTNMMMVAKKLNNIFLGN